MQPRANTLTCLMSNEAKRARTGVLAGEPPLVVSQHAPAMRRLADDGFAVIENVLSPEKCVEYRTSIYAYLRNCGVDMDDPTIKRAQYPNVHGIIQQLEVGQCNGVWGVRQEETITDVFAEMFGTNDLLVSFDGVCVMPPHHRDSGKRWLHVDQSHRKLGRHCIQGYINLTTSHDECSGSLMVIPRSHHRHTGFAQTLSAPKAEDWYKFEEHELASLGDAEPQRVYGGLGSLVLWDSRTAHQACAPSKQLPGPARARCVVYVCYQPRAWLTKRGKKTKQAAFSDYRMTTHWPASAVRLFSKTWRTYGQPLPVNLRPVQRDRVETPRMLELAGMTPLTTRTLRKTHPQIHWDIQ